MLAVSACCTPAAPQASAAPTVVAALAPHDESETESDRVVTERVRTLFHQDFEIQSVSPRVAIATRHGIVTLTGNVDTDRQRLVMGGHARATDGVTSVDNRIALAP